MADRYSIELEPEVERWLDLLPREHYRAVEFHVDRLADLAETLGEPYSRHLGGPLRELRLHLGSAAVRERTQLQRARWAQKACEQSHSPTESTYHRTFEEPP